MKKLIPFLSFLFVLQTIVSAQTFQPKQFDTEDKGVIYKKEFSIDLKILQTNGFALGVNFGKLVSYHTTRFWHFEFGELKHPKEFRKNVEIQSGIPSSPRSYIFGKQNNLFVLRGGFGIKRYLSEKAKRKGVAVGYSYEYGPTLGLLKPYYLELWPNQDNFGGFPVGERYSPENEDRFLDPFNINGASGLTKGLGEINIRPGVHGQFAFHFDWGAFDEVLKALEAGIIVDYFFQDVPLMVEVENVENTPLFINFYVNLQFGKRW